MIMYVFLHYRLFVLIWWPLSPSSSFNNPSTLPLQTLCSSLSHHHVVSRLWVLSHIHLVLLLSRISPDRYTQKSDAISSEQKRKIWIQIKLLLNKHDFRISCSSPDSSKPKWFETTQAELCLPKPVGERAQTLYNNGFLLIILFS